MARFRYVMAGNSNQIFLSFFFFPIFSFISFSKEYDQRWSITIIDVENIDWLIILDNYVYWIKNDDITLYAIFRKNIEYVRQYTLNMQNY